MLIRRGNFYLYRILLNGGLILLALASLALTAQKAQAAVDAKTYYVSPSGSDSNPGTSRTSPWLTLQKAANTVSAGDTVTVLPGSYASQRVTITRSGTASAPITFQAEGLVKMKGFTVTADYITVRGFYITGTDNDWTDGWGIYVLGHACLIESNHIYYATHGGIMLYTTVSNPTATSGCTVRNNKLERNSQVGIEVHGRNHLIEGNEVWGTIQHHPTWTDSPDWADADGMHFFGSGHIFRGNYIHDIVYGIPENVDPHIDCFQTFANSSNEMAQNDTFEDNTCINNQVQSKDIFGKGFMLQNADHLLIRNNVISAYAPFNINGDSNITIVNNDISSDLSQVMSFDTVGVAVRGGPNTVVKNNIFYNLPNHIYVVYDSASQQGLDIGHNLVYRSDGQQPWGTAYPGDLWQVNPLLANPASGDYSLQARSPAIDAGVVLSAVSDDYAGTQRPQGGGPDIGAFEYVPPTNPVVQVSPAAVTFNAASGSTQPQTAQLNITNSGTGAVNWSASSNQSWLTLSATSGSAPMNVNLYADPSGLQPGSTNTATLTIQLTDGQSQALTPQQIMVSLQVAKDNTVIPSYQSFYLPLTLR